MISAIANKVDMKLNGMYHVSLLLGLFTIVFSSHFRGGYITWKPDSSPDSFVHDKIIVTWRLSWRNSYDTETTCNAAKILSHGTLPGSVVCDTGCTTSAVNNGVICTDFSPRSEKDWSSGENTASFQLTNSRATLQYSGNSWINLNNGGGNWLLQAHVDLKRRPDNNRINSSPTTIEPPIVYTQRRCPISIKVPVFDADGDIVRCKWAVESGGILRPSPSVLTMLDEANCRLSLVHNVEEYIAIALAIEDFIPPYKPSSLPLSTIPLQFLVKVTSSNHQVPCDQRPVFVDPTPDDGAVINIETGSTLNLELRARGSTSFLPITAFTTISPRGLIKSDIMDGGHNEKYVTLNWTPPIDQFGSVELFCFSADDNVQSSEQRCLTFTLGEDNDLPIIIGLPSSLEFDTDPKMATARVYWEHPTVNDNSHEVALASNYKPGDDFEIGNTTVTYEAVDASGNKATASFLVTVTDNEAPRTTSDCPAFIDVFTEPLLVYWSAPNFTDNSGQVEWTSNFDSPSTFEVGSHRVVYVAVDSSENTANCTIFINVTAACYASSTLLNSRNFTWPLTLAGIIDVDALETCGNETKNSGRGEAVRMCEFDKSRGARWRDAKYIGCGEKDDYQLSLSDLSKTSVVNQTVVSVAQAVVNATSNIQNTTNDDIQDIATTLSNIVDVRSDDPQVTVSVVNIVNNVIMAAKDIRDNANNEDNLHESDHENSETFLDILSDFEDQVARATQSRHIIQPVVEDNIIFATTAVSPETTDDVTFQIIGKGSEQGSLTDVDIGIGGNDTLQKKAVRTSVSLPGVIFKEANTTIGVSFVIHRTDVLFPSNSTQPDGDIIVGADIISILVAGAENIANLSQPVVLEFTVQPGTPSCVFWDFKIQDWSHDGCQIAEHTQSKLICHCNHLTNFAVLVDANYGSGHVILDVISQVGCVVSMVALLLTIVIFLKFRRLRRGSGPKTTARIILIQFCIALCLLYFMFLVGIDQTQRSGGCVFVAMMLQYLTLCSLMWMGVEAQNLYANVVRVFDPKSDSFLLRASIAAWGIPILITVISMAAGFSSYKHMNYCYVASYPLYFGVILPVATILLHNLVIFAMVMRVLLKTKVGSSMAQAKSFSTSQRLKNAISITVLIGLTWIFGFFAIEDAEFAVSFIFCLCNSCQGIVIFVLFCARQEDVKAVLRPYYNRICGIHRSKPRRLSETGTTGIPSGSESVTRQPSYSTDDRFKQYTYEPVESFNFEPSYQMSEMSCDTTRDHDAENDKEPVGREENDYNDTVQVNDKNLNHLIDPQNNKEVNDKLQQNSISHVIDNTSDNSDNKILIDNTLLDIKCKSNNYTDNSSQEVLDQRKLNINNPGNCEENEDKPDATASETKSNRKETLEVLPSAVDGNVDNSDEPYTTNKANHDGGKHPPKKRQIYSVYEVNIDDNHNDEEQRPCPDSIQLSDKKEQVVNREKNNRDDSKMDEDSDEDMLVAPIVIENAIRDARVEIDND